MTDEWFNTAIRKALTRGRATPAEEPVEEDNAPPAPSFDGGVRPPAPPPPPTMNQHIRASIRALRRQPEDYLE